MFIGLSVSSKDIKRLEATKADRIKIERGLPTNHEGQNGDLSVRQVPSGLGLYGKFNGKWYKIGKLEDITRDGQAIIGKGDDREFNSIGVNDNIHFNRGSKTLELSNDSGNLIANVKDPTINTARKLELRRDINGGSPTLQMGSSDSECLQIVAAYPTGGKGIDYAEIRTKTESVSGNAGSIKMIVDDVTVATFQDDGLDVAKGNVYVKQLSGGASLILQSNNSAGAGDDWTITSAADHNLNIGNDIASAGTPVTHISITPNATILDANVDVKTNLTIPATGKLRFDGSTSGDTYITESATDTLDFVVGGDIVMQIDENGGNGNIVEIDGCVAFKHGNDSIYQPTYGDVQYTTDTGNNTDVDFRECQKARLELTGGATVAILGFVFPAFSGNFTLALEQDGSGIGLVTEYKAINHAGTATTDVKFPGGTNPILTRTANKTDIISIFWDAESGIAYAATTLNF